MSERGRTMIGWGLGIVILLMLCLLVALTIINQRRDVQVDGESIRDRAELHQLVNDLKVRLDHNDKVYGNRGIIQVEVLDKAFVHGWFTPEEERVLREVANTADYPAHEIKVEK